MVIPDAGEHKLVDRDADFGRQLKKMVKGTMEARARGISVVEGRPMASGFDNLLLLSRAQSLGGSLFLHLLETL